MFIFAFIQPLTPCVAVLLPPPTSISRSHYITRNKSRIETNKNCPQTATIIEPKVDILTVEQMEELHNFKNAFILKEEAGEVILQLRGGDFKDYLKQLLMVAALAKAILDGVFVEAFQPRPGERLPPHLQWLYNPQNPKHDFGDTKKAGRRSTIVTDATRNAGSEKKETSKSSLSYTRVMDELERQVDKATVKIQLGDVEYTIKNKPYYNVYDLETELAGQVYNVIRESNTDIANIAKNINFKSPKIEHVKNHSFIDKHVLDRYEGERTYGRFDPDLQQGLAWMRLESGSHTEEDITWFKHELAERRYELKHKAGYNESHEHAHGAYLKKD